MPRSPQLTKTLDAQAVRAFETTCEDASVSVISVDVFDTLLLRTSKPEFDRFYEISERQADVIGRYGHPPPDANDLYLLRRETARIAYRMRPAAFGAREARWDEIFQLMLASLGVAQAEGLLKACLAEELSYESQCLFWNSALGRILERAAARGKTIVALSDMYLTANAIRELIEVAAPGQINLQVYSSADFGFGKASGRLFHQLAAELDVQPAEIAHVGDNYYSDFAVPRSLGVRAHYLPRPFWWRVVRRIRTFTTHLEYPAL